MNRHCYGKRTIWTVFLFPQTSLSNVFAVHDSLLAAVAAIGPDVVLWACAATHTISVTELAVAVVVVLVRGTLRHAVRTIAYVLAVGAVLVIRAATDTGTFLMAKLAALLVGLIDSGEKGKHTCFIYSIEYGALS